MIPKIRIGRWTASLLLVAVGLLLLSDGIRGRDDMLQLLRWWPAALVLWGVEYVVMLLLRRRYGGGRRFRLDVAGMLAASILCASAFIVTQQSHYLYLWNKVSLDLTSSSIEFSAAEGNKFTKPSVDVAAALEMTALSVEGINGDIVIRRGFSDRIRIRSTVWVDKLEPADAREVAEKTGVKVDEGETLAVTTEAQVYGDGGRRQPRVDLEILLPPERSFDMDIRTNGGSVTLNGVQALRAISVQTGGGNLSFTNVGGNVSASTSIGGIAADTVAGNFQAVTQQGDIDSKNVAGSIDLQTLLGDISASGTIGGVAADTRNGSIEVAGANFGLSAQTLNGNISIRSRVVQGDWSVYSAVGRIDLTLPDSGDYRMEGSNGYGDIRSELPFAIEDRTLTGTYGEGEFTVQADGNGDLNIFRAKETD
ncbi:DUF4097 family beta strand repeat-containing protein [Saccharibacillus sp. CPCC 101409]|uniref:DUF4097 family beta strand repeat-containing protein n=1 Tax=Saccharibacillus sp. CPCC 101409 TaxID=3058041 RepID=UPI0026735060|nr:DUF4097 family beta strand repeat-containing protein [Saccharibacillus sp. CPCC 101409]MDO3412809.1 DUF4097 family beta strand repeat-containing protein [Saccharibacillus sp. CPCC 101409]